MAVLLRLCDEDRQKYGGPEWVRFDEKALDRLPFSKLHELEVGLNITFNWLFNIDKRANMLRWKVAQVWLARKLADIETPDLPEFDVMPMLIEVKPDDGAEIEVGDAVPPGSLPSSADVPSKTASRRSRRKSA